MGIKTNNVKVNLKKIPKGMKAFTVVNATIKDSTGSYRAAGEVCLLEEKLAKSYHAKNMIQVDLPSFDEDKDESDDAGKPGAGEGQQAAADAGADNGKVKP